MGLMMLSAFSRCSSVHVRAAQWTSAGLFSSRPLERHFACPNVRALPWALESICEDWTTGGALATAPIWFEQLRVANRRRVTVDSLFRNRSCRM